MKYIKRFSAHTDYEEYIKSGVTPNISACDNDKWATFHCVNSGITQTKNEPLCFTALEDVASVSFNFSGTTNLEYRYSNDASWSGMTSGSSYSITKDSKIYVRAKSSITLNTHISGNGKFSCCGNIMSLLGEQETAFPVGIFKGLFSGCTSLVSAKNLELPDIVSTSGYTAMFLNCSNLISAPELPATELKTSCYESMFEGCTRLLTTPTILQGETLKEKCYFQMFKNCFNISETPKINARSMEGSRCCEGMFMNCTCLQKASPLLSDNVVDNGYEKMFENCTSLQVSPPILAREININGCSKMFNGCTSMISASRLEATILGENCYSYMFSGCTSLISAPELPATELEKSCYQAMFNKCENLVVAPELPAEKLAEQCYQYMFQNCKRLSEVKIYANEFPWSDSLYAWLGNVKQDGTLYCKAQFPASQGPSGIPTGWTRVEF